MLNGSTSWALSVCSACSDTDLILKPRRYPAAESEKCVYNKNKNKTKTNPETELTASVFTKHTKGQKES